MSLRPGCHPSRAAEIKHWPDPGRLFITGAGGHRAGGRGAGAAAAAGRASCTSAVLAGEGELFAVGALGLLLCWRALKKLRLLLRRPTFTAFTPHHVITNTAAAGISISRPRSSCRPATTGGLAPRLSCRWACVPARGDHGSAVQQGNRRFWLGMAAALAMAAGTSLTITALALLVHGSANWRSASVAIRRQRYGSRLVGRRWRWPAASYCWRRQG
ncbi:putative transmembrane protein [Klebsiella pneumoniae]|uniref:Putative transmembrane protein n=1 Tax=Klebsiella pneumoniae TaxID=573 RepID=A0A377XMU6_KLEPN|nr:putative transmembrane protein [Klebsiella pneumoniae]